MRLTSRRCALLFVLALSANSAFAIDPVLSLDQNVIRTWGVDQGLPQGTVYALAQGADGYVWAATQEGFVRFDGTEFVTYDKAGVPQIHNNMTLALLSARDGSLYAATNGGGVVHLQNRRIRSFDVSNGMPSDAATSLYESGNGTIWIGTQKGLASRRADGRIVTIAGSESPSMAVTTLAEDWNGQLWIGTTHGVATLKDGRLVRHDTDGFPTVQILSIGVTRDGSVWIGTRGNGLLRYRSGQFRTYAAADGLPSANVSATYEDSHGTLWIGTLDHGVGRFRNEHFDFNSEAIGIGKAALARATQYAKERIVFGRPIGKNQAIQHPLAESWMQLEAANLLTFKAAWLYDNGKECGAEANAAKYLGARTAYEACERAILTHGGYGYAKEFHVERFLREILIARIAPVSEQLILCYVAERVLGLPKSY